MEGNTTTVSSNAHPLEETPTLTSWPQLVHYASHNQNKSHPAQTRRSPTPDSNSNDTQHSSAKRLVSDTQQSLAFIDLTIHTRITMAQKDKMKRTHPWPQQGPLL